MIFPTPKHRLYIDEVGNASLKTANNPNDRYLSLTGVIFSLEYVKTTLAPELEAFKQSYFGGHPDDPIVLHRKELFQSVHPFKPLLDPEISARFYAELFSLIRKWEFSSVTSVLDKFEHQERYTVWQFEPYHYCLHVLLERYVKWLEKKIQ